MGFKPRQGSHEGQNYAVMKLGGPCGFWVEPHGFGVEPRSFGG